MANKTRVVQLDDGREWLTDGHAGIACETALNILNILGILQEIAACNCSASIANGILVLEDGTTYDLNRIIQEANK